MKKCTGKHVPLVPVTSSTITDLSIPETEATSNNNLKNRLPKIDSIQELPNRSLQKSKSPFVEAEKVEDPCVEGGFALLWCAFCGREVVCRVRFKNSAKTFWSSVTIFILGGALGCFLLPYYTNVSKKSTTYCSKCLRDLN